jgi:hypothetical protein
MRFVEKDAALDDAKEWPAAKCDTCDFTLSARGGSMLTVAIAIFNQRSSLNDVDSELSAILQREWNDSSHCGVTHIFQLAVRSTIAAQSRSICSVSR